MDALSVAIAIGIAAVTVSLFAFVHRFFLGRGRRSTIPGLESSSDQLGNLGDVGKAGSLHQFLLGLHKQFGPITSFWWGKQYTVSISSPDLFRQHQHLPDRPGGLFRILEPLITKSSIQYANGEEARSRRKAYDNVFLYEHIEVYYKQAQEAASRIISKWDRAQEDDHLPLCQDLLLFSIKSSLTALLGDTFTNDEEFLAFKQSYDVVWQEMENCLADPGWLEKNSSRARNFDQAITSMRKIIARALEEREGYGRESRNFLLIDAVIEQRDDEEGRFADTMSFAVAGFHTTAGLLTWCIYYMCIHEEVQEKLYREIVAVLGPTDPVTAQSIGQLKYLRQVLDETLRCAVVAPWAARYCEEDMELGGHTVPAGVPVIHALGVSFMDENTWPDPSVFDPDRFTEEKSKARPTFSFTPFGFAGKRRCPGYRAAYITASVLLVAAIQRFKFRLVPGQDVQPRYGLVTLPKEEILCKIVKRT